MDQQQSPSGEAFVLAFFDGAGAFLGWQATDKASGYPYFDDELHLARTFASLDEATADAVRAFEFAYPDFRRAESIKIQRLRVETEGEIVLGAFDSQFRIEWTIGGESGHGGWHSRGGLPSLRVYAGRGNARYGAGTHRIVEKRAAEK